MSGEGLVLEEGGIADLDAVMAVMDESFPPDFGEAWTASQCAGLLPLPGVWLSLARESGRTVGFAMARVVAGEAELLLLGVCRAAQGRGIGRALLDRFVAVARGRGARRLHLEVRDGNHAVNLYKRAGFHPVGRRKNYYRGPNGQIHDALTLAKDDASGG